MNTTIHSVLCSGIFLVTQLLIGCGETTAPDDSSLLTRARSPLLSPPPGSFNSPQTVTIEFDEASEVY